ncbi:MAG: hypothetical protein HYY25_12780 [Candidatus Wallbacteria bacterium]|nr:hypothetical protein [Candidatus Wallbacteria bacterium]
MIASRIRKTQWLQPVVWVGFAAALALATPTPVLAGILEKAVLALAEKDFVTGEDRPRTDGELDRNRVAAELRVLASRVPRWAEAMRLHADDPKHPHTIAEHGLRALYHYARGQHGRSSRVNRRTFFVGCLTALLHDMGKLDSPRSASGRQLQDPSHPALCAAYIRKHAVALELEPGEAAWVAKMLAHHRDLGVLQRSLREPSFAKPAQVAVWRTALARALRTRPNLDFLAALTEADVKGINGNAYDDWNLRELLPVAAAGVASELPGR